MDTISSNIANVNTTRTEDGGPYQRKEVVFSEYLEEGYNQATGQTELMSRGVQVDEIYEDTEDFRLEYDPTHPDADENGYVTYPNVDLLDEMVELIAVQRAYESNVTAFDASKNILNTALKIGQ
jgi:flagellar basal-body rod protein FlgC